MSTHIKLISENNEAYVVLTKKIFGIPIPGKTYYSMSDRGLISRSSKIWMSLKDAQITFQELENQERNRKEEKKKIEHKKKKKQLMSIDL